MATFFSYFLDYFYYLHEPHEENHLLMSVYPYEVTLIYMDAENQNGMGGIDIIYKKELVKKIPGKGGCEETQIKKFIECIQIKLVEQLEKAGNLGKINCKSPALNYTDYDSTSKFKWII